MGRNALFFALISLLLVTAVYVYGAESRDIDFSSNPVQIVTLNTGDEVRFNLLNGEHNVMLKEISRSLTTVKVGVTPYIPNQVQVGIIGLEYVMNVDLNEDGYEDLRIDIYNIADNNTATLILLDTSQKSAQLISAAAVADTGEGRATDKEYKSYLGYISIVLGVLILILLIRKIRYASLRSKGKKILEEEGRKKPEENKEEIC